MSSSALSLLSSLFTLHFTYLMGAAKPTMILGLAYRINIVMQISDLFTTQLLDTLVRQMVVISRSGKDNR